MWPLLADTAETLPSEAAVSDRRAHGLPFAFRRSETAAPKRHTHTPGKSCLHHPRASDRGFREQRAIKKPPAGVGG